jgi:hypothetical protein
MLSSRLSFVAFLMLVGGTPTAEAQILPPSGQPPLLPLTTAPLMATYRRLPPAGAPAAAADSVRLPRTAWKTGLLVGGTLGAVLGVALGSGLCHDDNVSKHSCVGPALGSGLVVAMLGGTVGALLGGQVRQPARP